MAFCEKCGTQIPDGEIRCANCVEPTYQAETYSKEIYAEPKMVYAQPQAYAQPKSEGTPRLGLAIASMICGITGLFPCYWFIFMIFGIVGFILGLVAKAGGCKNAMATAGIICGIISTALGVIEWVIVIIGIATNFNF